MPNSWVFLGGSLPSRTWLPSRWWWVFSWAELLVLLLWPPGHICLRLPVSLESSSLWGPASASQCSWSWPQHRRKGSIRGRVELRPRVLVNGRHVTMVWHLWDYIWEDFQLTFWGPVGSVSAVLQWGGRGQLKLYFLVHSTDFMCYGHEKRYLPFSVDKTTLWSLPLL